MLKNAMRFIRIMISNDMNFENTWGEVQEEGDLMTFLNGSEDNLRDEFRRMEMFLDEMGHRLYGYGSG